MSTAINLQAGAGPAPKSNDEVYKDVVKWAKVAVCSISVIVYGVERTVRYGTIPTELSGVDPELNAGGAVARFTEKFSVFSKIIKYVSYVVKVVTFIDTVYEYMDKNNTEVRFLGMNVARGGRRLIFYITLAVLAIPFGVLYYIKLHTKVSAATKRWEKPINVISTMGTCFYGIGQLVLLIQNPDIFKGKKFFTITNIINNISGFVELPALDTVIYEATSYPVPGAGYIAVYGLRTVIKGVEVVALGIEG